MSGSARWRSGGANRADRGRSCPTPSMRLQHTITAPDPTTALTELYLEALGHSTVIEMFEAITRRRSAVGGHLAPLAGRAAAANNDVADEILAPVADQHADMVGGVATQLAMLDDDFELVTSGGVHASGGVFSDRFMVRVRHYCPRAVLVPLDAPPVTGALLLALELVP